MTKKFYSLLAVVGPLVLALSCGRPEVGSKKPIAKVNDYVITERDFRLSLSDSVYFHNITGLTLEEKKRFLDEQIGKELLIQAAVKEGLDRDEHFRQAIEKYWEQTLITTLVERKGAELKKEVLVTREEIEARYRKLKGADLEGLLPDEVAERIEREIHEEKETQAMKSWTDDLRRRARITIYEDNLKSLR